MSWAKFDDRIAEHPKFVSLNDAGWSLFMRAVIYCCRYRTNGDLDPVIARRLGSARTFRELVRRRILEPLRGGGFRVHDFLDYQCDANGTRPPTPEVRAARSAAGKKGAESRWQNRSKRMANAMANLPATLANFAAPDLPISRSPEEKIPRRSAGFEPVGPAFAHALATVRTPEESS